MRFHTSLAVALLTATAWPASAQTAPPAAQIPADTSSGVGAAATSDTGAAATAGPSGSTESPAAAQTAREIPPAIDLMQRVASSFDLDGDGKISEPEFEEFSRSIWFSKDANDDKVITEEEFKAWDFGFAYIAAEEGKAVEFDQVKSDLFAYWDANGDGQITPDEIAATAKAEFANADADHDGFVSGRDLAFGSPSFNAAIFAIRR